MQAFTLEDLQSSRYDAAVESSFRAAIRRSKVRAVLTAFGTTMLVFISITVVLWMGAREVVLVHDMTWGQLSQFFVYAAYVGTAAASLTEMWGEVQRAAGAMERLAELLVAEPTIAAPTQPAVLPARISGHIRFEGVTFSYPSRLETRALDKYTLEVRSGETVAFVGPSGAGKSTTFQLLLRFYDPQAAESRSMAVTSRPGARRSYVRKSDSCRRIRFCSAPARARTSITDDRVRPTRRSWPRRAPPRPMSS